MSDKDKIWKVIFFPSDKTFTVLNSTSSKNHIRFEDEAKVSVRFGQTWFEGNVLASTATKKEGEQTLLQMTAKRDEGKKFQKTYFFNCFNNMS